jgi:glycosyltransferase involved in cell wall biosynthesis
MGVSCRVGFDAGPAHSAYSGIGQYVRQLFPAMFQINSTIEWVAFTPSRHTTHLNGLEAMAPLTIKPAEPRWLPSWLGYSHESLDLFHGTNFKAPNYGQKKTILTIHDLWLERYPAYSKKLLGQGLSSWKTRRGAIRAEKIIAVSQFSKQEIHEVFAIPLEKIAVRVNGMNCALDWACLTAHLSYLWEVLNPGKIIECFLRLLRTPQGLRRNFHWSPLEMKP